MLAPIPHGSAEVRGVGTEFQMALPAEARIGDLCFGFISAPNRRFTVDYRGVVATTAATPIGGQSAYTFAFTINKTLLINPPSVTITAVYTTYNNDVLADTKVSIVTFAFAQAMFISNQVESLLSRFVYPGADDGLRGNNLPQPEIMDPLISVVGRNSSFPTYFLPGVINYAFMYLQVYHSPHYESLNFPRLPPDTVVDFNASLSVPSDYGPVSPFFNDVPSGARIFQSEPIPVPDPVIVIADPVVATVVDFNPQTPWYFFDLFPLPKHWEATERYVLSGSVFMIGYQRPSQLLRLRYRQRDDWPARTGRTAANQPSSRQRSVRTGPGGVYS